MTRTYSVFDRDARLVLTLKDERGTFSFTRPTGEDVEAIECPYASLRAHRIEAEPELLNILFACNDLVVFLEELANKGYTVTPGHPQPGRFARL